MKRIAFFGPLPPSRTGIADYDEELLPLLRKHFQVDVFLESGIPLEHVFPHTDFYLRNKQKPYDLCLYQLGNSMFHDYIYGYLYHFPGAVVFHDVCLHHSRAGILLRQGQLKEFAQEATLEHPQGETIALLNWTHTAGFLLPYFFPFVKLVLRSCLAGAAHTDTGVENLRITDSPVVKIPHLELSTQVDPGPDPFPGKFVIGSFGLATRAKRLPAVLNALASLRRYYPNLLYLLAGDVEPHYDLHSEIKRRRVQDIVHLTGHIEMDQFLRLLRRADVTVNLRYPSAGEMSGTLVRALACGKPVLISRLAHLQEIPSEAVLRVRPDYEEDDVFNHLSRLIENPDLRKRIGSAARNYVDKNHSPELATQKYCEFIELALERKSNFKPPELPLHLRSGKEIVRSYVKRTCFENKESDLLDWIL